MSPELQAAIDKGDLDAIAEIRTLALARSVRLTTDRIRAQYAPGVKVVLVRMIEDSGLRISQEKIDATVANALNTVVAMVMASASPHRILDAVNDAIYREIPGLAI